MTIQELIEEYRKEHCSKCNKDIDCTITIDLDNKARCSEEE